jgi:hypothetical protein
MPHMPFAYVDPGSGLMLLQIISAAVVGIGFYLMKARKWLGNLLRVGSKKVRADAVLKSAEIP